MATNEAGDSIDYLDDDNRAEQRLRDCMLIGLIEVVDLLAKDHPNPLVRSRIDGLKMLLDSPDFKSP